MPPRRPASRANRRSRRRCLPATRWRASSPRPRSCGRARACSTSRPSSVIKRMKDKAFARAVPREHLKAGAEEMGLPLDQHITNVIASLREKADELGLRGALARTASVSQRSSDRICRAWLSWQRSGRTLPVASVYFKACRSRPAGLPSCLPTISAALRSRHPSGSRRQLRSGQRPLRQELGAQGRVGASFCRARSACSARTAPARARSSRRCSASSSPIKGG